MWAKVSLAAASFSIYAFEALQEELQKVDQLRFIFTSPTFNKERARKQKRELQALMKKMRKEPQLDRQMALNKDVKNKKLQLAQWQSQLKDLCV